MGKIGKVIQLLRSESARIALLKIWRYIVLWSPLSRILRPLLPQTHKEQLQAFAGLGYWPDVRNPRSFNEKVLYRKLYTNDELYSRAQDKYRARSYVAEQVGEDVLTDLYHVTEDPSTIPSDDLPDEFVIKATHGQGWIILVDNKDEADFEQIRTKCRNWADQEYGRWSNEYWYWEITPRIIVEEYIHDEHRDVPLDFKFFVFDGNVEMIQVDVERFSAHKQRFYTPCWEPIDVKRGEPIADDIDRPPQLSEMVSIAETVGEEFDFVRVDLYNPVDGRVFFGEFALAPGAGRIGFEPVNFDFELGSHWPDSVTSY